MRGRKMTAPESKPHCPVDPEKGAAGKDREPAEKPFFASPFREKVVYAYYTMNLLVSTALNLAALIIKYMEVRDRCQCRRQE